MRSTKFFKSSILGPAVSRLTQSRSPLLSGPMFHQWRSPIDIFKREFHYSEIPTYDKPKTYIGVGGGISAFAHIGKFCEKFYEHNEHLPKKIVVITDEKNHWLNHVHADFYSRKWGQPVKALILPLQKICSRLFPDLTGDDYPELGQIKMIREAYIKSICTTFGVILIDDHVEKIIKPEKSAGVELVLKNKGSLLDFLSEENLKIFNFATQPRLPKNSLLASVGQDGGLLYSQKKSDGYRCIIGGGLTAAWASKDFSTPILVIRPEAFELNFDAPKSRTNFCELIEEKTHVKVLKSGEVLIEGTEFQTGSSVRLRIPEQRCFLSTGAVFNSKLTQHLSPELAQDINPYSISGKIAGQFAVGTVNPEGGLTHRYAIFSSELGRFPVEDITNMARYINLWRQFVEKAAEQHSMTIHEDYFNALTPVITELFRAKTVPTQEELESQLRSIYESLPPKENQPTWERIKDIVVPVTDDFDHYIHPDSAHYPSLRI